MHTSLLLSFHSFSSGILSPKKCILSGYYINEAELPLQKGYTNLYTHHWWSGVPIIIQSASMESGLRFISVIHVHVRKICLKVYTAIFFQISKYLLTGNNKWGNKRNLKWKRWLPAFKKFAVCSRKRKSSVIQSKIDNLL